MSGGASIRSRFRGSSGVEMGTVWRISGVLHRLVADEQVVVDLHDDQAPRREADAGPLGQVVAPWPGAQKLSSGTWGVAERGIGQGPLPEAGPPLSDSLSRSAVAASDGGTRYRVAWWTSAAREELAGDDVRVLGDVGVEERAVVVVGRTRGRLWAYRSGASSEGWWRPGSTNSLPAGAAVASRTAKMAVATSTTATSTIAALRFPTGTTYRPANPCAGFGPKGPYVSPRKPRSLRARGGRACHRALMGENDGDSAKDVGAILSHGGKQCESSGHRSGRGGDGRSQDCSPLGAVRPCGRG